MISIISIKKSVICITILVIVASAGLAGCSSGVSQSVPSSSAQQSSGTSEQKGNDQTQQPPVQPGQSQQPNNQTQQPPGQPGQFPPPNNQNMTDVLNRAAEILGISQDDFNTAFQNSMPSGPSGQQGELPEPPQGQQGEPPAPPQGLEGERPERPMGQQMFDSEFMTEIYEKMAEELQISVDDIVNAISQAQEELND